MTINIFDKPRGLKSDKLKPGDIIAVARQGGVVYCVFERLIYAPCRNDEVCAIIKYHALDYSGGKWEYVTSGEMRINNRVDFIVIGEEQISYVKQN